MRNGLLLAAVAVVLAGCANDPYWLSYTVTAEQMKADQAECLALADSEAPFDEDAFPSLSVIGAAQDYAELWETTDERKRIFATCMIAKGYKPVTKEELANHPGVRLVQ